MLPVYLLMVCNIYYWRRDGSVYTGCRGVSEECSLQEGYSIHVCPIAMASLL